MNKKVVPFPVPPPTPEEQAFDQLITDFMALTPWGRREVIFNGCEPEEMQQLVDYLTGFLAYCAGEKRGQGDD